MQFRDKKMLNAKKRCQKSQKDVDQTTRQSKLKMGWKGYVTRTFEIKKQTFMFRFQIELLKRSAFFFWLVY